MITLFVSLALAQTDEIGGNDTYNNDGDMLKVVAFDVAEAAVVTELQFAVYNYGSHGDVILVLYERDGDGWALVDARDATNLPADGEGWASSGAVSWLLEPGKSYAMGSWIADDWYYFYDQNRPDNPWFGETNGSYRYSNDGPPDRFTADKETYFYWIQVTSEDADVDGDGAAAARFGGPDCDDEDAAVNPGAEDICGDGVDQDCSGADLPCDDTDPGDSGGTDDSGDSGGTGDPDDSGDGSGNGGNGADGAGEGGTLELPSGACGCASGVGAPLWLGLLALGLARRRSR